MVIRFFGKLSCRQGAVKMACVATLAQVIRQMKKSQKKSREIQWVEFFATKSRSLSEGGYTCDQGWRRDNFEKIASPSQAKNRSCSRGFTWVTRALFVLCLIVTLVACVLFVFCLVVISDSHAICFVFGSYCNDLQASVFCVWCSVFVFCTFFLCSYLVADLCAVLTHLVYNCVL